MANTKTLDSRPSKGGFIVNHTSRPFQTLPPVQTLIIMPEQALNFI